MLFLGLLLLLLFYYYCYNLLFYYYFIIIINYYYYLFLSMTRRILIRTKCSGDLTKILNFFTRLLFN